MNQNFAEGEHGWHKTHADGYNTHYRVYSADYCRSTELPMFSTKIFSEMDNQHLYTCSRAKKEHVFVDETQVSGWYRVMRGYVPVYRLKPFEYLTNSEFLKSVSSFVSYNHPDLLSQMLAFDRSISIVGKSIDKLIDKAIDARYHECYLILLNWKNEYDLYTNPLDKLKL